jgi:DNA-binding response OmpR family regulator
MDLDSEELRKNGLKIKLTGQPFRLLAEVAEHTGRVVTYEELQAKFWPGVTIEDPRHSLSNSMLKKSLACKATALRRLGR